MALESVYKVLNNIIALDEVQIINSILKDSDFQKWIISLNQNDQLFEKGINSLGSSLGDYAATTIEGTSSFKGKKDKGQRFDHITLLDTGDFYKTFKLKVQNGGFEIIANGQKDNVNLLEEYKDVLGLTDENFQLVIDAIKERFIPIIIEKIAA